jgi:hypothetical protein
MLLAVAGPQFPGLCREEESRGAEGSPPAPWLAGLSCANEVLQGLPRPLGQHIYMGGEAWGGKTQLGRSEGSASVA